MNGGQWLFGKLTSRYVQSFLLLLILASVGFLIFDHIQLSQKNDQSIQHWVVMLAGIFFTVCPCLLIFFSLRHEIGTGKAALQSKINELQQEREIHRQVEENKQKSMGDMERKTVDPVLLSTVIEQTEDNVLISDSHRTILYINPAFERSSGYSCDELKGKPLRFLRSDQHDESFFRAMKETLDKEDGWIGVIVNRGKNGIDFEIEGTISPIRDDAKNLTYWVAVGRNMSRFRKLERELFRVQKMDALGTLAGGIAHDFNNILAAIMGLIELEFIDSKAETQTRKRMEQALSACGRARDLIKQILAFSSKGEQRRKPLRVLSVIEESVPMVRATLPTTISIHTNFVAKDALILGDSTQVQQIFVNLCTNASHAMRLSGGTLGIGVDELTIHDAHDAENPGILPGEYVRITVSDSGIGMDKSVRERIFEPFFSTKGPGEGSGIGLSVVHGIVESHRGKIRVVSEPGKGSTFEILFPKIEGAEETLPSPPEQPATGNERILLVDDEEIVIIIAEEMLTTLGYQVVTAKRGAEALEIFRAHPERFQLMITDQTMPGMTGTELAAETLRIRKDLPIILCTGFANHGVHDTALDIGIRKVIAKPFVLQELAATIRSVLE